MKLHGTFYHLAHGIFVCFGTVGKKLKTKTLTYVTCIIAKWEDLSRNLDCVSPQVHGGSEGSVEGATVQVEAGAPASLLLRSHILGFAS